MLRILRYIYAFDAFCPAEVIEKENKPKDVTLRVTVDGDQVEKKSVKENATDVKVKNVSGKGTVVIKVYIDDTLKKTINMNLNEKTEMTIE